MRVKGLEPPRLTAPEPKSGASTYSATPAQEYLIILLSDFISILNKKFYYAVTLQRKLSVFHFILNLSNIEKCNIITFFSSLTKQHPFYNQGKVFV